MGRREEGKRGEGGLVVVPHRCEIACPVFLQFSCDNYCCVCCYQNNMVSSSISSSSSSSRKKLHVPYVVTPIPVSA